MCLSLYSYRSFGDVLMEQCLPMESVKTEIYAMGWIPMMVWSEECRVWSIDGSSAILPPLTQPPQVTQPQVTQPQVTQPQVTQPQVTQANPPQIKKTSDVISTAELLRLVAQGRARFINAPVNKPSVTATPINIPKTSGPCELETCTGRCGMPLHTRSNVMLAKAVRTGNILWGDLV